MLLLLNKSCNMIPFELQENKTNLCGCQVWGKIHCPPVCSWYTSITSSSSISSCKKRKQSLWRGKDITRWTQEFWMKVMWFLGKRTGLVSHHTHWTFSTNNLCSNNNLQWKCLNCKVNQNLKLIAQNLKLIVLSDRTMYINKYSEANTWASLS